MIRKLRQTIEELEAYRKVVNSYKADRLQTMKWGYQPRDVPKTPRSFQRYKLETRLYHSGYSINTLKPEVLLQIEKNKPGERREMFQKKLLETSRKRSNFLIDRKMTNAAKKREEWEFLSPIKLTDIPSRGQSSQLDSITEVND